MGFGPYLSCFKKSMNYVTRLIKKNCYFSNQSFQIWWLISSIEVMKKYKISAQYLQSLACYAPKNEGHDV